MKCSKKTLISLGGAIWFFAGAALLILGARYIFHYVPAYAGPGSHPYPFLRWLDQALLGRELAVGMLILAAFALGSFKEKRVLSRVAKRAVNYVQALPPRAPLYQLYPPRQMLLIATMMLLARGMAWFGVPPDLRGFIDLAVGVALMRGAKVYWQAAYLQSE